ncbi:MAG TPA: tyrosine-type recombinase/integrase [Candidatus Limnocylindria bacterium]|jgi:site-specific recombinase XerD|nr:tyrosine-type recombinase/integrase [Candidatus Limnocylindria bacterium]
MAHVYRKPDSKFWWISRRDLATGARIRKSTGLRHGIPAETRKAKELEALANVEERRIRTTIESEAFTAWVPQFLRTRYSADSATATLVRYLAVWQNLQAFMEAHSLVIPRQFTRDHCYDYLTWRKQPQPGTRKGRHNTILMELKIFGLIMREAVRRKYAEVNPVNDLNLKKEDPRKKPELTVEQIQLVSDTIDREGGDYQVLLRRSWDIARYHGARLNETWLNPMTDVWVENTKAGPEWRIRFVGKKKATRIVPLAHELIPLFAQLQKERATQTYERPMNRNGLSRSSAVWTDFLHRTGLRHKIRGVTHHCLRVTMATNLARNEVPENKAMRFMGHASTTVHRAYQDLKAGDLDGCLAVASRINNT